MARSQLITEEWTTQEMIGWRARCNLNRSELGQSYHEHRSKAPSTPSNPKPPRPYRYLYCVDLDATCDDVGESPRPLAVVPNQMETIEIGLMVIDLETLEVVDEFQRFVRPLINPIRS
ncbi:hypothetical protein D3C72_1747740 [compost metagenome]